VDWLTWPSRRVKLIPSAGTSRIHRVVITPGDRLPDTVRPEDYETFVPQDRRSRDDVFSLLRFQPDRAAWRASVAILARRPPGASPLTKRAPIVDHLDRVREQGQVAAHAVLPVVAGGLAVDRAKVLTWSEERLSPLGELLADEGAGEILARAVEVAEELGDPLERAVADALGAPRRGTRRRRGVERRAAPHFFASLGLAFEAFLQALAQDPVRAAKQWSHALRTSIEEAWTRAVPARVSARELQAAVAARSELHRRVQERLASFVSDARARAASMGVSGV
jgi:CRISPR type I-E-associated protein CasA/Cse1